MGDSPRNELREAKHAKVLYISFGVFQDAALFDTKEVGIMNLGEYYFANLKIGHLPLSNSPCRYFRQRHKNKGQLMAGKLNIL